jgi:hypothetical protein
MSGTIWIYALSARLVTISRFAPTLVSDRSMTVIRHPITRLLPPSVSNSEIRFRSCGTTLGMKGSKDVISNERVWPIEVSILLSASENFNDAYVYAHPQSRGSSQPNRHLRAGPPILQQMNENLPDPWVIRRTTLPRYPLPNKPRNTALNDAVPLMVAETVSRMNAGPFGYTDLGSGF